MFNATILIIAIAILVCAVTSFITLYRYHMTVKRTEDNTIRAINDLCKAIKALVDHQNKFGDTQAEFMNNTNYTLYQLLVTTLPLIDMAKSDASDREDFEKAKECNILLQQIKEMLATE